MEASANFNIGRIKAIRTVQEQSAELNRLMGELSEPMLTDLGLLPRIYDLYCDVFARRGFPKHANQVYHRKKLILIVLYLYSPRTLAGGRMVVGLRAKLADVFGLRTGSPISDNCTQLMFIYDKYRDFRRDVGVIYEHIMRGLQLTEAQ